MTHFMRTGFFGLQCIFHNSIFLISVVLLRALTVEGGRDLRVEYLLPLKNAGLSFFN